MAEEIGYKGEAEAIDGKASLEAESKGIDAQADGKANPGRKARDAATQRCGNGDPAAGSQDAPGQGSASVERKFTKGQLLNSARFHDRRDLVDALLSPGREYTVSEVEQMARKYMKGKVK